VHPIKAARLAGPIYYATLRTLGVTAMNRRWRDAGLVVCYHNVVPDDVGASGDPGLHIPVERFERQMRWLAAHYQIVPLRELVGRLNSGAPLRSIAAITFDDAYAGVFDHALPILERLGLPATVFVVGEAVGRRDEFWWDRPEIARSLTAERREALLTALRGDGRTIASAYAAAPGRVAPASHRPADAATLRAAIPRGIDLGVHSATHRSLPTLTDEELEYEIVASRAMVHEASGMWPEYFAYPYGLWNSRVRAMVHAAGYRAALTLDGGLNPPSADPWSLRRVNVPAGVSDAAFEAWTGGLQARHSA
jgi:peptidoglycan/xylan/chitin deacetylase (PgdA/CDA1 family)